MKNVDENKKIEKVISRIERIILNDFPLIKKQIILAFKIHQYEEAVRAAQDYDWLVNWINSLRIALRKGKVAEVKQSLGALLQNE